MHRSDAAEAFTKVFGYSPHQVTRAPGRVNLIGEHTDYNDGWVMPVAIEYATWTAIAPRRGRTLRVIAGNRKERVDINLDDPGPPLQRHWSDYVRGVAVELERGGARLTGADLWFAGNVPDGAGLSSSAALEMSIGLALLLASKISPDRIALARAGQRAEHHFAGTKCGIMDQFISAHGRAGHALMLDCRSLEFRHFPIPDDLQLVICDTGVKHELASGEYNRRRAECEEGVQRLRDHLPNIRALRDVTSTQLAEHGASLSKLVLRRCRHVVSEDERVQEFAHALTARDHARLGELMAASHASLRDDYEVSCKELDIMVELAKKASGIIGARMTGGGFGGCTVNLVEKNKVEDFRTTVAAGYERAMGKSPRIITSAAAEGACLVEEHPPAFVA